MSSPTTTSTIEVFAANLADVRERHDVLARDLAAESARLEIARRQIVSLTGQLDRVNWQRREALELLEKIDRLTVLPPTLHEEVRAKLEAAR